MADLKEIVDCINKGNLKEALKLCDTYENEKNKKFILNFRGAVHLIKGNLDIAEKNFLDAARIDSKFIDPLKNLYLICLKKRDYKDLLTYAQKLLEADRLENEHNYKLAYAFELNNNLKDSIEYYKRYVDKKGKNSKQAFNNIGCIYLKRNKPKIAINFFKDGLNFGEDKTITNNIFKCYVLLRDLENSDFYYDKAIKFDENYLEFKHTKAKYFILKNQITEAIEILKENKDKPRFLITLLVLYFNLGKNEEGIKLLNQSKDKMKKDPIYYNYLGLRLLYEGDFKDGWRFYEHRNSKKVDFFKETKEWSGETIENKNIVVFTEQGLGDAIQFSKYIIPLCKIAKKVTFVTKDSIKPLFKEELENLTIETIESCKNKKFDLKIALGSLIKFFFEEKFSKNENLIISNKALDLKWKKKIPQNKLNIGISWSGSFNGPNEPYRSIPLQKLEKLFSLDVNFYCLQNEIWDRDLDYFKTLNLTNCGEYKLTEIASIIQNLDLVITSDTSLLHLSASLNKQTWGLLSLYPDWRWSEFNKINPYSNLKIFKQKSFKDWSEIEELVVTELQNKIYTFNNSNKSKTNL